MILALLAPIPVAAPLVMPALLLATGTRLPACWPDVIALLTTLGAGRLCAVLAAHSAQAPAQEPRAGEHEP